MKTRTKILAGCIGLATLIGSYHLGQINARKTATRDIWNLNSEVHNESNYDRLSNMGTCMLETYGRGLSDAVSIIQRIPKERSGENEVDEAQITERLYSR